MKKIKTFLKIKNSKIVPEELNGKVASKETIPELTNRNRKGFSATLKKKAKVSPLNIQNIFKMEIHDEM